jgi:hypothetical protein
VGSGFSSWLGEQVVADPAPQMTRYLDITALNATSDTLK